MTEYDIDDQEARRNRAIGKASSSLFEVVGRIEAELEAEAAREAAALEREAQAARAAREAAEAQREAAREAAEAEREAKRAQEAAEAAAGSRKRGRKRGRKGRVKGELGRPEARPEFDASLVAGGRAMEVEIPERIDGGDPADWVAAVYRNVGRVAAKLLRAKGIPAAGPPPSLEADMTARAHEFSPGVWDAAAGSIAAVLPYHRVAEEYEVDWFETPRPVLASALGGGSGMRFDLPGAADPENRAAQVLTGMMAAQGWVPVVADAYVRAKERLGPAAAPPFALLPLFLDYMRRGAVRIGFLEPTKWVASVSARWLLPAPPLSEREAASPRSMVVQGDFFGRRETSIPLQYMTVGKGNGKLHDMIVVLFDELWLAVPWPQRIGKQVRQFPLWFVRDMLYPKGKFRSRDKADFLAAMNGAHRMKTALGGVEAALISVASPYTEPGRWDWKAPVVVSYDFPPESDRGAKVSVPWLRELAAAPKGYRLRAAVRRIGEIFDRVEGIGIKRGAAREYPWLHAWELVHLAFDSERVPDAMFRKRKFEAKALLRRLADDPWWLIEIEVRGRSGKGGDEQWRITPGSAWMDLRGGLGSAPAPSGFDEAA